MKRWIKESNEKPITAEQIEEEYDNYSKGLQWQLIENKLIQNNDIKVTHEEVVEHTKGLLLQQMAGMGLPDNNDEELTETANRVLQNEEEARNLYMMLYDERLMNVYKEKTIGEWVAEDYRSASVFKSVVTTTDKTTNVINTGITSLVDITNQKRRPFFMATVILFI